MEAAKFLPKQGQWKVWKQPSVVGYLRGSINVCQGKKPPSTNSELVQRLIHFSTQLVPRYNNVEALKERIL